MSSFKNLSMLSLACLIFTILVVVIEYPFYSLYYKDRFEDSCLQVTTTCYSAQFFNGAGIILFAFTNQCNVLPVYSELVNPVKYRLMKIIKRSIILVLALYICMSVPGYLSTLNNTPEVVLSRQPFTSKWSTDWFSIGCSCLVVTVMVTNIVLNYIPFRNSLYYMTTGREKFSTKFNIICTACF